MRVEEYDDSKEDQPALQHANRRYHPETVEALSDGRLPQGEGTEED